MNKIRLIVISIFMLFVIDLSLFVVFLSTSGKLKTEASEHVRPELMLDKKGQYTITIPYGDIIIVDDCQKDK